MQFHMLVLPFPECQRHQCIETSQHNIIELAERTRTKNEKPTRKQVQAIPIQHKSGMNSHTHFPDGRIVTPLKIAAASAAARSFIPPLAAFTAAIEAAAACLSTESDDATTAGDGDAFFFLVVSFGVEFLGFFPVELFSATAGSEGAGAVAGRLVPNEACFDDLAPFIFFEFNLLDLVRGGCEL